MSTILNNSTIAPDTNGKDNLLNSNKEKVLRPFHYVASMPGKNIRQKLALAFNHWFKVGQEDLKTICGIISVLHNATLVIDDIEDSSDMRRGLPAAHEVFGIPLSINAAYYACFDSLLQLLASFKQPSVKLVKIYAECMVALHMGQGMEIYWRDGNFTDLPTEVGYEEVIIGKTSSLFMSLVEYLKETSTEKILPDVTNLVKQFGLYFQIRDDLMNLCSKEYEDQKGFCEDITEGKLSYPVVYVINRNDNTSKKERLVEILRLRTRDRELKLEALEILNEFGALEYTRQKLASLQTQIRTEIETLGGNPLLEQLIANFFVV